MFCQANRKEVAMSKELMEYFNTQPRLGTLSTASKEGKVDVAYFGSAQMTDEKTVVVGLGHNRSFANLRENPYAVFMIMQPGEDPTSCPTKGVSATMPRPQEAVSVPMVRWYLDRPGAPANGHPQDQHLCQQLVLILLSHPTKQHKKFALDISCSAFFPMLFQIVIPVLKFGRQFEPGL